MLRPGRIFLFVAVVVAAVFSTPARGSSFTVDQCATCGPTGGAALQIINSGLSAPTTTAIVLINTSASFNPASITSISASVQKDLTESQSTAFTGTFSSGFRPAVEQDGNIYMLNPSITGPTFGSNTISATSFSSGWGTISQTGLTLSEFELFNFSTGAFVTTSTPNGTDAVYFGIGSVLSSSNTQLVSFTSETDFANLSITDAPLLVDNTFSDLANYQIFEFPSTPEPSTLVLLGTGLAVLCARVRRHRIS